MDNAQEVSKIKDTSRISIAEILGCSLSQAGKFKRGFSGLSNHQAQILKKELGLSPEAFEIIYVSYQTNKLKEKK